jgi:hypothetical protein
MEGKTNGTVGLKEEGEEVDEHEKKKRSGKLHTCIQSTTTTQWRRKRCKQRLKREREGPPKGVMPVE